VLHQVDEVQHVGDPVVVRHVVAHAAGNHVVVEHPAARDALEQIEDLFPLAEAVQQRRPGAHVQPEGGQGDQMAGDARQFRRHDAQMLGALGHFLPHHFLDRGHIGVVAAHRGQVVEAVGVDHPLLVVDALGDLLGAAVQVAQHRRHLVDDLAVGLQQQAQHAVRRGMLRAHVELEQLALDAGHVVLVVPAAAGERARDVHPCRFIGHAHPSAGLSPAGWSGPPVSTGNGFAQ